LVGGNKKYRSKEKIFKGDADVRTDLVHGGQKKKKKKKMTMMICKLDY
jgi:hypothetical protein